MRECPIHKAQHVLVEVQQQDVSNCATQLMHHLLLLSLQLFNKHQLICKVDKVRLSKVQVHACCVSTICTTASLHNGRTVLLTWV